MDKINCKGVGDNDGFFEVVARRDLQMSEPILINNWEELRAVKDSETHKLYIEEGNYCGWIIRKKTGDFEHYLSTHTFYDSSFKKSTSVLQSYGFNVQILKQL